MSQQQELNRVKNNIADLVEAFVKARWEFGTTRFYIKELHAYIAARTEIAPASPDRILRQLRRDGKINYVVTDRRASCYQLTETDNRPTLSKSAVLLYRGKPIDRFPVNGKRFQLPSRVIEHLFSSNEFELEITT
jgi:protein-L-isoaspartate O-methyltransferase